MIGLIAALPDEINAVSSRMSKVSTRTIAHVEFRSGHLGDEEIVIALSGVGKVSAAIASTLMCQLYQPSALISIGVAGGLCQDQNIGDLVISNRIVQADYSTEFIDGLAGRGKVFQAHPALIEQAKKAAEKSGLNWRLGDIATQDLFMADSEDYARLLGRFPDSACSEMEGGAVAQCARAFSIPALVIRTLSDVVAHEGNNMEFEQFAIDSSAKAAQFLEIFCTHDA